MPADGAGRFSRDVMLGIDRSALDRDSYAKALQWRFRSWGRAAQLVMV